MSHSFCHGCSVGRARIDSEKRKLSNFQWRVDFSRIYGDLQAARKQNNNLTLHNYCMQKDFLRDRYRRISQIWKELQLENLLQRGVGFDTDEFNDIISGKFPPERGEPKTRKRTKQAARRTNSEWETLLLDIYTHLSVSKSSGGKASLKSYTTNQLKDDSQYRRITDVWKDVGLDACLAAGVCHGDPSITATIRAKYPPTTTENSAARGGRVCSVHSTSYFNADEEDAMCEAVAGFARLGYPLEKGNLRDISNHYLRRVAPNCLPASGVSQDTTDRMYKDDNIQAKTNVNPIDPRRASQATPQTLNCFYHQLDAAVKMAHEINPTAFPEDRYVDIPPSRIYNSDEQGPNPTKLRNPVLIPEDMLKEKRNYQNTREGDGKMQMHYSVANIVRADGIQSQPHDMVEGAPPPMILISDKGSADELDSMDKAERDRRLANQSIEDEIRINPNVVEGWFDDLEVGNRVSTVNPFGFLVRTTPTGSMLKRTFYDFILHFKNMLPHNQGEGGLGVVLTLDWHCSRECPQSLLSALLLFNILVIVLPSKTSIWGQPCDNGKNELVGQAIAKAAHDQGILAGQALDYLVNFNTSELKVSLTRAKSNGSPSLPLSKESIDQLENALVFAVNRSRDMLVILVFPNHFLPQQSFQQVKTNLEKHHVEFLSYHLSDLFVMRTQNGHVITVKVSGGSILFAAEELPAAVVDITSPAPLKKMRAGAAAKCKPSTPTPKRNNQQSGKRKRTSDEGIGELTQECLGLL